jgi:hypothetical protein
MCDSCGVGYYRSQLVRKPDRLLYCPDDVSGKDRVTIGEELKRAASRRRYTQAIRDGGSYDHSDDPPPDAGHPLPVEGPSAGTPGDGIEDP